ncbi:MAG: hypothetical protein S4CHLAM123_08280 [Chlamydiales bacterium]|nr:hypothetical protein [Chlamydiales bacterium]
MFKCYFREISLFSHKGKLIVGFAPPGRGYGLAIARAFQPFESLHAEAHPLPLLLRKKREAYSGIRPSRAGLRSRYRSRVSTFRIPPRESSPASTSPPKKKGKLMLPFFVRRRWDSNPRYVINAHTLSKRAPSAARTLLQKMQIEYFMRSYLTRKML